MCVRMTVHIARNTCAASGTERQVIDCRIVWPEGAFRGGVFVGCTHRQHPICNLWARIHLKTNSNYSSYSSVNGALEYSHMESSSAANKKMCTQRTLWESLFTHRRQQTCKTITTARSAIINSGKLRQWTSCVSCHKCVHDVCD